MSTAPDSTLDLIVAWCAARDDVRAAILTSTRAVPGAKVDALSDYDLIVVVRDVAPYAADRSWIGHFGRVLVAYWDPVEPEPHSGLDQVSNIVQYEGTLKIDFTVWSVDTLRVVAALPLLPAELDAGYRVLVDKDGLAATLPAPTGRGYVVTLPGEAEYLALVNDFFVGVPYVAKCLVRDEVLPARWCLDYDMRYVYLLPMLEWLAASLHGGEVRVGVNGKGLKALLPSWWARIESTWTEGDVDSTWESLERMVGLFRRAALEVGAHYGHEYPEDLHRRVMSHAASMRAGTLLRP